MTTPSTATCRPHFTSSTRYDQSPDKGKGRGQQPVDRAYSIIFYPMLSKTTSLAMQKIQGNVPPPNTPTGYPPFYRNPITHLGVEPPKPLGKRCSITPNTTSLLKEHPERRHYPDKSTIVSILG